VCHLQNERGKKIILISKNLKHYQKILKIVEKIKNSLNTLKIAKAMWEIIYFIFKTSHLLT
jgi:hypothetical protein